MTQDRIIELAREAGFSVKNFKPPVITAQHSNGSWIGIGDELERFAALVRAETLEEAAGMCEEVHDRYPTDIFPDGMSVTAQSAKMARITANNCAAAIRALKGQP